jgi:hypothetical protein
MNVFHSLLMSRSFRSVPGTRMAKADAGKRTFRRLEDFFGNPIKTNRKTNPVTKIIEKTASSLGKTSRWRTRSAQTEQSGIDVAGVVGRTSAETQKFLLSWGILCVPERTMRRPSPEVFRPHPTSIPHCLH